MLLDEKINDLQNLTRQKIPYKKIAEVLGLGSSQAVQNRITRKQELKEWEVLALDDAFLKNINTDNQETTNKPKTQKNNDIISIPYIEWLPEEMRNPKYPDVVSRSISIEDWGEINSLRIVAMNGDSMENYWYIMQNKDVLLIDTSETQVNADGRGVYFATTRNNTKFWVREMTELLDESIEFSAYPQSGTITKTYTKKQLQDADFRIIGKVIKNVSLKLK